MSKHTLPDLFAPPSKKLKRTTAEPPPALSTDSAEPSGNVATHPDPPGGDAPILKDKIASAAAAARVDADPPLGRLERALKEHKLLFADGKHAVKEKECVVYWMRMEDMRLKDNSALSLASSHAQKDGVPLVVLFVFSPADYDAHDRSPRRIDFMLRNLRSLRASLSALNIPLHAITNEGSRASLPRTVMRVCEEWKAGWLCANIEYEVDELRRDEKVVRMAGLKGLQCEFVHDKLIVAPGRVLTKEGKPYSVYSPWLRNWTALIASTPAFLAPAHPVTPNPPSTSSHPLFGSLLTSPSPIPASIPNFECADAALMATLWPEGEDAAAEVLRRFLRTKARKEQLGAAGVLADGAVEDTKGARVRAYAEARNRADMDTSSRLSPYLASGVISARECLRQALALTGKKTLETNNRADGVQMWTQEIAWRDFYTHIIAAFPRVSMGRPFLEKFSDVKWEVDEAKLQAWKDGRTGFPIVDAAMRQAKRLGWMHNRARMVAASFLVKDLMVDWRLGERYFMQQFIDGDLASNNGGWQWTASTGTDPQPYFRIFQPTSQAEKADPTGDYIRHFVPELKHLRGKVVYNPHEHLPSAEFKKLGYPAPIVDHKMARERALRRYKNPGCE